jgi:hypothetical protein
MCWAGVLSYMILADPQVNGQIRVEVVMGCLIPGTPVFFLFVKLFRLNLGCWHMRELFAKVFGHRNIQRNCHMLHDSGLNEVRQLGF